MYISHRLFNCSPLASIMRARLFATYLDFPLIPVFPVGLRQLHAAGAPIIDFFQPACCLIRPGSRESRIRSILIPCPPARRGGTGLPPASRQLTYRRFWRDTAWRRNGGHPHHGRHRPIGMYVRAIHGNVPAAAPARALLTVPAYLPPSLTAPSHRHSVPPYHVTLLFPFP